MLRRYIINNYGVAPPKNVKTVLKHFASVHFSSTTTTGGDDGDGEDNNNNNNNSDSEDNNNINDDDDVGTTIDTTQESVTGVARRGFEPLNTLKILKTASKAVANKHKDKQDAILRYRMNIKDEDLGDIRRMFEQRRLLRDVQKSNELGDEEMMDVDDEQPEWVIEDENYNYPPTGFSPTDVETLYKFLHPSGKIMPRYQTKLRAKHQRKLAKAVKAARQMGLIPTTYALPKHLQEKFVPEALYARAQTMTKREKTDIRNKKKKERKKLRSLENRKIILNENELPSVLVSGGPYLFHNSMEGIGTYVERVKDGEDYEISLRGSNDNIERILEKIEHRKQNLITETLEFPKELAIPIIGKKGANLRRFGQDHGVYLKLKSDTSGEGNFDNLKVEMIGLQEEVEFASEAMKIFVKDPSIVRPFRWRYEYLLHNHFSSEIGKINAMCSEFKGHVVFKDGTVLCYVDKMNPFSKKKSKDTMAKAIRTFASEKLIRLPINSSAVPDWLQPLFGDTNGNKNAFLLKKYLMQNYNVTLYDSNEDDDDEDGRYWVVGLDDNDTRQFQSDFLRLIGNSFVIDNSVLPRVLGQVKKIQDTTNTFIQFLYKDSTKKENVCLIIGSDDNVNNAKDLIEKISSRDSFEKEAGVQQTMLKIREDMKYDWSIANEFINCSVQSGNNDDEVAVFYDTDESLQRLEDYIQKRNLHVDGSNDVEFVEDEIYLPSIIVPQISGKGQKNLRCLRFFTGANISLSDAGLKFQGPKEQVEEAVRLTRSKIEAISQQATDKPTDVYEFPVAAVPVFMQKEKRNAMNEFTRISAETGTLLQFKQEGLDLRKKTLLIFGTPAQCKVAKQRCVDVVDSINIESVTVQLNKYTSDGVDTDTITDGLFDNLHNFQVRSNAALIVRSDTVEIHGDERYIDKGVAVLGEIIDTFKDKETQMITIPENRISEIIGGGGKNIRRLKKISGCSGIQIHDERTVGVEEGFKQVEFTGKRYQTEIAIDQLFQDLEFADRRYSTITRNVDNKDLQLLLQDDGEFLRNLIIICGIKMSIKEEETLTGRDSSRVEFKGFGSNLYKALSLIEKYVKTGERPEFFEMKYTIKKNKLSQVLGVPGLKNIGKNAQSTIPGHLKHLKMVERNSLALFKSLSKRRYGVVDLTIVGTKEEISKARQLLDPDQVALFEIQEEWLEREKMGVQAASYS